MTLRSCVWCVWCAWSSVIALALALAGCGSAAVSAASRGDVSALRAEIESKHRRGALSNAEAASIGRAVIRRELRAAKNDAELLARLDETRACALELDEALSERMAKHDGAGAEAAIARVESGGLSFGRAREFLSDGDDRWRAVATRALTQPDDGQRRRRALLDPSPRVRRGAIRAAADARDLADLDVLFETARLDPELGLRSEAIRAASAVLRALGLPRASSEALGLPRASSEAHRARAEEASVRLRDLWTSGDDALREVVAVAWALSPVLESGGREALRIAIASERGPGAIAAAGVVSRAAQDAELVGLASALLARTIAEGSRRDRLHAIFTSRPQGQVLEALREAAEDGDLEIRVAALGRLLDVSAERERARTELEKIASYGVKGSPTAAQPRPDDALVRVHASRARLALAMRGDLRVQAWIEEDLASDLSLRRLSAASALAALGRAGRAAPLLVDADPTVRTRAACTMIVAARR